MAKINELLKAIHDSKARTLLHKLHNGGGIVIGTEMVDEKAQAARKNRFLAEMSAAG